MRLKLTFLFLLTVLIPTAFLAYFSLLAVKGEREILETNMRQKYQAMADVVLGNIESNLKLIPERLHTDPKVIESILYEHTRLFEGEVMIFNREGKAVDGRREREDFEEPVYVSKVGALPYEIAIFRRHSVLANPFAAIQEKIARHIGIVSLCALAILMGGLFTLGELFRGWRKMEIKAEFISHLVHDLRGPLTSIRMFSEMLESNRVPSEEKRGQYYRIISAESEKLIHLADNVLGLSRIENRGRPYSLKEEDLVKVIQETITRFQTHIGNETHRIKSVLPPSLMVKIHPDSISQILMNLLSNAVKYSPQGSDIQVSLSQEGQVATLSVADQGFGIPKSEHKKIFRTYYRGQDPEVINREGSGLGLAVVKYAVMTHRGKISVKSEEGKGSQFKVELPIR